MAERLHQYSKNPPTILFVDTQSSDRIVGLRQGTYQSWVANMLRLPVANVPTINVADGEKLPRSFDGIDGIFGGGSGETITKRKPWMIDTVDFLHRAQEAGIPQLLVCFSHQLFAYSHRGEIETKATKRFGIKQVRQTENGLIEALLDNVPKTFSVFTSNSDVVTGRPYHERARISEVGVSEYPFNDPHEMLVYVHQNAQTGVDTPVHAMQFHPELKAGIIMALANEYNAFSLEGRQVDVDPVEIYSYDQQIRENGMQIGSNWITHYVIPSRDRRAKQRTYL